MSNIIDKRAQLEERKEGLEDALALKEREVETATYADEREGAVRAVRAVSKQLDEVMAELDKLPKVLYTVNDVAVNIDRVVRLLEGEGVFLEAETEAERMADEAGYEYIEVYPTYESMEAVAIEAVEDGSLTEEWLRERGAVIE